MEKRKADIKKSGKKQIQKEVKKSTSLANQKKYDANSGFFLGKGTIFKP